MRLIFVGLIFLFLITCSGREHGRQSEGSLPSAIIFPDSSTFSTFQEILTKATNKSIATRSNELFHFSYIREPFPSSNSKNYKTFRLALDLNNDHVVYYFNSSRKDSLEITYNLEIKYFENDNYELFYRDVEIGKHSFSKVELITKTVSTNDYYERTGHTYNLEYICVQITY